MRYTGHFAGRVNTMVDAGRVEYLKSFSDALRHLVWQARAITQKVEQAYAGRGLGAIVDPGSPDARLGTLHNIGAVALSSLVFAEAAVELAKRGGLPERLGLDIDAREIGVVLDGAVMPTLRWGTFYRWWNEYEAGLRSVLHTVQGSAPYKARELPAAVRAASFIVDQADWEQHFELCRTLRNLGHNADRLNPYWDRETREWRGRAVRFEPGQFPNDLEEWPYWWQDTLLAAVQYWAQIVLNERVIAIDRVD